MRQIRHLMVTEASLDGKAGRVTYTSGVHEDTNASPRFLDLQILPVGHIPWQRGFSEALQTFLGD